MVSWIAIAYDNNISNNNKSDKFFGQWTKCLWILKKNFFNQSPLLNHKKYAIKRVKKMSEHLNYLLSLYASQNNEYSIHLSFCNLFFVVFNHFILIEMDFIIYWSNSRLRQLCAMAIHWWKQWNKQATSSYFQVISVPPKLSRPYNTQYI